MSRPETSGAPVFVVQQHNASRLHYDFRLEVGGRLVSWAVPRGPTMDPGLRRLAVRVEDHPLEWGEYEGVISEGEYGAGEVIVWDRGTWRLLGDETAEQALDHGKVLLLLGGRKLRGRFVLLRTGEKSGHEDWLLLKLKDRYATPGEDVTAQRPESVVTGRTIADLKQWALDLKAAEAQAATLPGAEAAPMLDSLSPMEPGGHGPVPGEPGWILEAQQPGTRALAFCRDLEVRLADAQGRDLTPHLPHIAFFLAGMRLPEAVLDGVVAGYSAKAAGGAARGASYHVFDLPHFAGQSLMKAPLSERRRLLSKLAPDHGPVEYVAPISTGEPQGKTVAKRTDSVYTPGADSKDWVVVEPGDGPAREAASGKASDAPSEAEALALAEEIRAPGHRSLALQVGGATVKLTNLDKVFWAEAGGRRRS